MLAVGFEQALQRALCQGEAAEGGVVDTQVVGTEVSIKETFNPPGMFYEIHTPPFPDPWGHHA